MSGLENFQSSEDWLKRLKNFLIVKRPISPKMDSPSSPSPVFDLDKDFHDILEEKNPSISFKLSHDNKENYKPIYKKSKQHSFVSGKFPNLNDSLMPMSPKSHNCFETTANDSFFYLEKICNKSISDPDSTIHSYVENMRQESLLSNLHISNNTTREMQENCAIERLFNHSDIKENILPERTIFHVGDQTQLGDIEEPSGLWETTLNDETLLKMSPTKRVGLLRPSTILEEANSSYSESENNSVLSFKTALKSSETTSYETANDTIHSERYKMKDYLVEDKYKFYNNSYNTDLLVNENKKGKDSTFFDSISSAEQNKINSSEEQSNSKNTLDDVSSFLDDSLTTYSKNKIIDNDSLEKEKTLNNLNEDISIQNESFIEISDGEDNSNTEESSLNEGFSMQSINHNNSDLMDETLSDLNSNGLNVSRVFNDTFEEVDYILKKGMKMMNTDGAAQPITIKNTTGNSATLNFYSPSPQKTPKTPNTVISKQFSIKKITPSMNDKLDVFKKPMFPGGTRIPQSKSLNAKKLNPYANIISPVGAYIKNTPKTPIVSNIRETTVRSLDYAQINKNILPSKSNQQIKSNSKEFISSSLPKKAYISAQYQEVRDERTPLNIPGGNKIHKYLQPALIPAVTRHEGKMRIMKSDDNSSAINTTVDNSLADLSVMSGDVSVYTIRDAQNFGNNIEQKL